ncbi:MAG: MFS transporter [Clostridiales bacterium]|jgi:fucose permease|nr:MFS transporter [Clostridiales bacterium]
MLFLLTLIFVTFTVFGLPDSVLGSAWPLMYTDLKVPLPYAGIISVAAYLSTVFSAVLCEKFVKKFGTYAVITASMLVTSASVLGYVLSPGFVYLAVISVPLGLSQGFSDACLNHYVAKYFSAKHMNWLHCFWGLGATLGPVIMAFSLTNFSSWRLGYLAICIIQFIVTVFLFFSKKMWNNTAEAPSGKAEKRKSKARQILRIPGVWQAMLRFFLYCAAESTAGLWGASYMFITKGIAPETAARLISLYYFGITAGRFFSGFLTLKMSVRSVIRLGMLISVCGIILMIAPFGSVIQAIAFLLIGLGFAPVFPCMMHETGANFGEEYSQAIIGYQMACAYVGGSLMPALFGVIADYAGYRLLSAFLGALALGVIVLGIKTKRNETAVNEG